MTIIVKNTVIYLEVATRVDIKMVRSQVMDVLTNVIILNISQYNVHKSSDCTKNSKVMLESAKRN